jgi:methionyl-tRNA formyltransferase
MKTVFVGAVEGSKIALEALIRAGQTPAVVVTVPPGKASRHSDYANLVSMAKAAGSDVLFTSQINSPITIAAVRNVEPDLCMVIGWSQICSDEFLCIAKFGNIGFHPAPLPRFRGRAVIPWTILMNEKTSGSSLFWLENGIDSGPIILQKMFSLTPDETAQSLYSKHTANLAAMLPAAVQLVKSGNAPRIVQDHTRATYCAKRTPDDGHINWRDTAENILRLIRAVGPPYPGAFAMAGGEKLIINRARPLLESKRYIGLTGQIQSHTDLGFSVRCGDDALIEVLAWQWKLEGKPRIHSKLQGTQ